MRKLAAAGTILAVMVMAAPPAGAQRAVTVNLSGVSDNQVVQATVPLKGSASATTGVRRLTITVDGEVVAEVTPQSLRNNAEANYEWDTTKDIRNGQLAPNRSYEVRVRAVSNSGAEDQVAAKVIVDNAPATPTGLVAKTSNRTINLTWDANPEPDITGYRVERYYGNDYVSAKTVQSPAFSEIQKPGSYSYRVVALRRSEQSTEGVASAPTEPVTASIDAAAVGAAEPNGRVAVGGTGRRGKVGGVVTRRIGVGGLPTGAALPLRAGLSGLPDAPAAVPWGSYKKRLPYKLPKGGVPIEAAPARSGKAVWNVVPPDGLRWVALGLLILMLAALSRFWAWRLQVMPKPAKIEA